MTRSRTYRTEAVVLKQRPMGESDLLLTLYTPYEGKVGAVAKGARKLTSKLVGHLEPLTRVELSLSLGQSLDVVSQAQMLDGYSALRNDLSKASRGVYLAELVDGFSVERSGNLPLYRLLTDALALLGEDGVEPGPLLRCFEVQLLDASGFLPELDVCVECRTAPAEGTERFSPDGGGLLCGMCAPPNVRILELPTRALAAMRLLRATSLAQSSRLHLPPDVVDEIRVLLSACIRYWLERDVRSAAFLQSLSAERK